VSPTGDDVYGLFARANADIAQSDVDSIALPLTLPPAGVAPSDTTVWARALEVNAKAPVDAKALTVSPDGQTIYAVGSPGESAKTSALYYLAASTGDPGTPVTIGDITSDDGTGGASAVSESPNESTLFVAAYNDTANPYNEVYPIAVHGLTVGTPSGNLAGSAPASPEIIAVTPDQAPVADLAPASGTAGTAVNLNAGGSTVDYGAITSYAWNFGDGQTATTGVPTISHTYTSAGDYTVSVTETDTLGTSVPPAAATGGLYAVNTAGETPYIDASSQASITAPVDISPVGVPPPPVPTTLPRSTTTTTAPHSTTTTTAPKGKPKAAAKAALTLNPGVGSPGTIVTVTGTGFPPNTPITISWSVSTGSVVITSNAKGDLPPSPLITLIPDVLGPRYAVASTTPPVKAPFLVVPGTAEPGGDDGSYLFRSESQ
jgi:PKD domain